MRGRRRTEAPAEGSPSLREHHEKQPAKDRFELCEQYGYRGGSGSKIASVDEWEPDDREELTELLEFAASAPR